MAKYDYTTPKDILQTIKLKKKEGCFVQRVNDKKQLAQYYEVILKDKKKANEIYLEIRQDLDNELPNSLKGSSKEMTKFLRELQNKDTGSFVEYPTIFSLEVERAKHILRHLKREGLKPKYPLKFLDKVNSGKKLKEYFHSLLYDFSKNNEDELNLAITGLPTIKDLGFYKFSRDWEKAYYECLEMWQDPKTGYWGPWIKKGNKILKLPELSTTFHILRIYFNKKTLELNNPKYDLKHKNKLIQTTWDIKNKNYPYGWLEKRNWSTHHNFDVAEIFLYLFKEMNSKQKEDVRNLFHRFLKWDLDNLQSNGGFIGYKPELKETNMMQTNFAILVLRGIGCYSPLYREAIWKDVKLPINSYRIYDGKIPKNEFDTSNLKAIVYTKKTTLDPLDTRNKIHKFWLRNKQENPSEAINVNLTLQFEEYPVNTFKIMNQIPSLKETDILVAVDKYGRVIWSKGNGAPSKK